jgi:aryl-alcohol dehydrogenase-like predicted oxidoreductase
MTAAAGFGTWEVGDARWNHRAVDERTAAIHAALAAGITHFDTAPVYGDGTAETLLGQVFGPCRSGITLATKCGLTHPPGGKPRVDLSRAAVLRDCEASLARLGTDHIDLYLVHWPDPAVSFRETAAALRELSRQRLIRGIGLCNYRFAELCRAAEALGEVAAVQYMYNLCTRGVEKEILPWCLTNGVPLTAYSPLAQGLLCGGPPAAYPTAGDPRFGNPDHTSRARRETLAPVLRELQALAASTGCTPAALALGWVASRPGVGMVLCGSADPVHIRENAAALSRPLPAALADRVNSLTERTEFRTRITFFY